MVYLDDKAPKGAELGEVTTAHRSICVEPTNPESEKFKDALAEARKKFGDQVAAVEFAGCDFD